MNKELSWLEFLLEIETILESTNEDSTHFVLNSPFIQRNYSPSFCFTRRVEALTKEKSESERLKMEVEATYRTLQYKYDQECEARRVSEALHEQLKEQIARSDEKFAKYVNRK